MGSNISSSPTTTTITSSSSSSSTSSSSSSSSSKCPVAYKSSSSQNTSSLPTSPTSSSTTSSSGCPIRGKVSSSTTQYKHSDVYNVYNQKIDPTNQMPNIANQLPAPNQSIPLPTERIVSTIPKAGTDDSNWLYPSPQMFWNALVRKNKTDGANEEDIETVVAVHNNMNERTWKQVLVWEDLHNIEGIGREPKLLRFLGKPDDLSPKARFKMLFGHPAPFDRHDWIIDRGGKEIRYIIDYYHDESVVNDDMKPKQLQDFKSMKSIKIDVRPALDSTEAILDRIIYMPKQHYIKGNTKYELVPFFPPKKMKKAEENKIEKLNTQWKNIQINCENVKEELKKCSNDDDCGVATVNLQKCIGTIICPSVVAAFDKSVKNSKNNIDNNKDIEISYGNMLKCLETFELDSKASGSINFK
jgi:cytochrome c heme-lyase